MFGNIVGTFKTSSKLAIVIWVVLLAVIPVTNVILVKSNIIDTKKELLSLGQIQNYNIGKQRILANYLVGLHCQGRKLYYFRYDDRIRIINVHGDNEDIMKSRVSVCSYSSELMEATIFLFALILFTLLMSNYEEIINKIWRNTQKRRNSVVVKVSILFFCFLIVYQFMSILVTLGFLFLL